MYIKLNSVEKVKEFVRITSRLDFDIDLISGRYVVDAKSIMGIFSLDLSKALLLQVRDEEKSGEAESRLIKFAA